jgi:hypothetical protein
MTELLDPPASPPGATAPDQEVRVAPPAGEHRLRRTRRLAGRLGKWVVLAVVVEYLVVPQLAGTRKS